MGKHHLCVLVRMFCKSMAVWSVAILPTPRRKDRSRGGVFSNNGGTMKQLMSDFAGGTVGPAKDGGADA
jgi:hypothetical protein